MGVATAADDTGTDALDFERLVRAHTPALRRFCHRLAGPSDGDDLMQETLTTAMVRFGSLRDRERFLPWCRQIARHAHIRCIRTARAMEPLVDAAAREDLESELVDDMVRRAELARVLAAMPERSRMVLAARAEGVAPAALAETYGVSRTLVDTWFARSKVQARHLLQELRAGAGVGTGAVGLLLARRAVRRAAIAAVAVGAGVATLVLTAPREVIHRAARPALVPAATGLLPPSSPPPKVSASTPRPPAPAPHVRPSRPAYPSTPSAKALSVRLLPGAFLEPGAQLQPIEIGLAQPRLIVAFDPCWVVTAVFGSCPVAVQELHLHLVVP
jgi:RNA polymerase sigma factor (sigma-70 family)